MTRKKIVQDEERPWGKDDAQPLDDPGQRLAKAGKSGYSAQYHENHGRKREEHVEGNRLRQCDAVWNDA